MLAWMRQPGWLGCVFAVLAAVGAHGEPDPLETVATGSFWFALDDPGRTDLNGNAVVDEHDVVLLVAAWGPCSDPCPEDVDDDATVDLSDLVAVVADLGLSTPR